MYGFYLGISALARRVTTIDFMNNINFYINEFYRKSRSWLLVLLVGIGSSLEAEEIRVEPYGYNVNGYGDVQRIFGGCVNGSSRDEAIAEIRELNLNTARAYLWGLAWYNAPEFVKMPQTPWKVAQYGGKAVSREEALAQWDKFYAQDFSSLMEAWWNKSYPVGAQLYQAELFRKWDLTEGIILHTEVDGSADRHPEGVNRYYQAYMDTMRRHAPWMNIQFLQFHNEPDYSHWSGEFANTNEAVETFIRCFNRLDVYTQEHFGSTRLLGPCLSSGCFFSLSGWRQWITPVLKQFRQIDYFNYHCYDVPVGRHLAWLEMLQATGETLRGQRPRGVITEANFRLADAGSKKRFGWEAEQLFMALANPDKIATREYFLLVYPSEFDGVNLLVKRDGKFVPSDIYWLYWTLADLRGSLRWVRPMAASDLKTCAASPKPDQIVLSFFNDGEQELSVTANPGVDAKQEVVQTRVRQAYYRDGVMQHEEKDLKVGRVIPLVLASGEVATVRWTFKQPLPTPAQALKLEQFYCHQTNLAISTGKDFVIHTGRVPRSDEVAFVRLGITTDDVLFAKEINFSLNGYPHRVIWSDLPSEVRNEFANTWWVELPLDAKELAVENKIKFGNLDTNYRLLSASVVYRQFPSKADAAGWLTEAVQSSGRAIMGNLQVAGQWFGGSRIPVAWTLRNPSDQSRTYHMSFELPPNVVLKEADLSQTVVLLPGKEKKFQGMLEIKEIEKIQNAVLRLNVTTDDKNARTLTQNAYIYPRLTAVFCTSAPPCDGTFTGWDGMAPRSFKSEHVAAQTRLGWDAKNLYMRIDVSTSSPPAKSDNLDTFWQKDAIEMFLDLENSKSQTYDKSDFQLFFVPKNPVGEKAAGGIVPRTIRDDSVAIGASKIEPRFKVSAVDLPGGGYRLEAAIPWEVLKPGFVGRPGRKIGFDLAIDHFDAGSRSLFSESIAGSDGKPFGRPDAWGILTLQPQSK